MSEVDYEARLASLRKELAASERERRAQAKRIMAQRAELRAQHEAVLREQKRCLEFCLRMMTERDEALKAAGQAQGERGPDWLRAARTVWVASLGRRLTGAGPGPMTPEDLVALAAEIRRLAWTHPDLQEPRRRRDGAG